MMWPNRWVQRFDVDADNNLMPSSSAQNELRSFCPRVSILIPNYNNGRASSLNNQFDLIGDLCQSLWDTLHDDPTPFEILACDDGSTDDSLETLRDWSQKNWPMESGGGGRPFLELIEREHCGVLAVTANLLSRQARGEYLARLDGDVICLTPGWVSQLCEVFDRAPDRLGVVGPKQLSVDRRIHAFGDWLLHPLGYHHIAHGAERHAVRQPMACDHVMGCFYCCKKSVYEALGGYDEAFLRGQTIDFGLRARLAGYDCIAAPQIEFVHAHGYRQSRATTADTAVGVRRSLDVFEAKWGFDRLTPDLDYVRRTYAGTPLLWNSRWFAGAQENWPGDPTPNSDGKALTIEKTDWLRYTQDQAFKRKMDFRTSAAVDVFRQLNEKPDRVVLLGAGPGLIAHLLAMAGLPIVATDRHQANLDLAKQCADKQDYPASAQGGPQWIYQDDPRRLPFEDGQVQMILLFDQLERHPNPVGLLAEVHRVLAPDRVAVIVCQSTGSSTESPFDGQHGYSSSQLVMQLQAVRGFGLLSNPGRPAPGEPIALVAKRVDRPTHMPPAQPPVLTEIRANQVETALKTTARAVSAA